MRIVVIISSARKKGNTATIVKFIENEIVQYAMNLSVNLDVEWINLFDYELQLCLGCRICFNKGEKYCPLNDGLLNIRDKIIEADGVIFASPVYVEDANGIMKNFIDRMAFICHRPAFSGKASIIITTSGGGATSHAIRTISSAIQSWGAYISAKRNFRTGALIDKEKVELEYSNEINAIAKKFFDSLYTNKKLIPTFYSLMIFKIQQKNWQQYSKEDNLDYLYWRENGWLNKECTYYIPNNSLCIKTVAARFVGGVISKFFI
ncbi:flavodoxin family protein [Clostridium sp. 'White wine YQ']|uniref:flavodoxin family protein n=1 Tax=Clostridium sp. 'White wine YQ' TaxID=3027474 RepID=UPI002366FD51|nr:NAD(P)H-dependent oxidoreductase [Clostridium sp. 'White wine YQ']MDD7793907.1 NAD(P)H-dependent oxidoreductase [Clostridium sp. 'White wine YQ']